MDLAFCLRSTVQLLFVFIAEDEHAVLIVVPVIRDLIQCGLRHQRRFSADIAPFVVLSVFNPSLKFLDDFGALRHDQRKTLTNDISCCEQFHLAAQAVVVAVLDIRKIFQILFQIRFLRERCAVDSGQHFVMLVSPPVCSGCGCQLERLDLLCAHQVRSRTELDEISLLIEGDGRILRQIIDQLNLVRLLPLLHQLQRFLPAQGVIFQPVSLFYDFLHRRFYPIQVGAIQRFQIKIVVKPVVDGRTDGKLRLRENLLYSLRQHMGAGVAIGLLSGIRIESQNADLAVSVHNSSQIDDLAVHLADAGDPGKPFTDVLGDFIDGKGMTVFLNASVLQCDFHKYYLLLAACRQKQTTPLPTLSLSEGTHTDRIRGSTHLPDDAGCSQAMD